MSKELFPDKFSILDAFASVIKILAVTKQHYVAAVTVPATGMRFLYRPAEFANHTEMMESIRTDLLAVGFLPSPDMVLVEIFGQCRDSQCDCGGDTRCRGFLLNNECKSDGFSRFEGVGCIQILAELAINLLAQRDDGMNL